MIEIKHLRLIRTIAEVGSLSKAAGALHLTQSALSHQLRQLEDHLGLPVFYRTKGQLHFTPAGKEFSEMSKDILTDLSQLEFRIAEIKEQHLSDYVHGYSQREMGRLYDQATSIADILHWDSYWDPGTKILEAGCGVGAQTSIIAPQNPEVAFVSIDLSRKSIEEAKRRLPKEVTNVSFEVADILDLPYPDNHFDHLFVCFVLEHLKEPVKALKKLTRKLKAGGTITVIEGDHGSTYFHPASAAAEKVVLAQVTLQSSKGGDANIGRRLYPLLKETGFEDIKVTPRQVYVDPSKPELVEGFILNTFTAMIEGVAEEVIGAGVLRKDEVEQGLKDLRRTAKENGTFCYTFFKAKARKG